jgi:hypothetical protein
VDGRALRGTRFASNPGVLAIVLMNLLAFDQHFAVAAEQPIIIPEIFHRWRLPGDENKPGIAIDEISRCMGSDLQARELYDYLIREGAELEHASGEVAKEMESVRSRQTDIQAADAKLGDSVRGFNERGEALERRRADIERARKTIQAPQKGRPSTTGLRYSTKRSQRTRSKTTCSNRRSRSTRTRLPDPTAS